GTVQLLGIEAVTAIIFRQVPGDNRLGSVEVIAARRHRLDPVAAGTVTGIEVVAGVLVVHRRVLRPGVVGRARALEAVPVAGAGVVCIVATVGRVVTKLVVET